MKRLAAMLFGIAVILSMTVSTTDPASGQQPRTLHDIVTGRLKPAEIKTLGENGGATVARRVPWVSSGTIAAAQDSAGVGAADERLEAADAPPLTQLPTGRGATSLGCTRTNGDNVRVNQDCTFRRQAETEIAVNPRNDENLVGGQNDSRVGFNQCGIDWSTDGGETWGDLLPPFRQKLNNPQAQLPTDTDPNSHTIMGDPGTFHTYDAGSDPTVTFDSRGRAFFSCVVFDLASNASGLYVTQSPAAAHGSYFFNVGSPLGDRPFMVVEDNSPFVFHDKQFIAADSYRASPNRDNVYVTWTVFRFSPNCAGGTPDSPAFCSSAIYGSMSTDHAVTWSTPEEISGQSPLCHFGNFFDPSQPENACNNDQGSDPVVLPNGDLSVPFNNGNTEAGNPNGQQLAVHCSPSGDSVAGTAHLNCQSPTKVGDDIFSTAPRCDFGRGPEECVPGIFVRTNDFPRSAVSTRSGAVYVAWQDYRHGRYEIQLSVSHDGGMTWSPSRTISKADGRDHYFPAVDVGETGNGDRVGVSYYRTGRVPGENTTPEDGFVPGRDPGVGEKRSDYVLAGGEASTSPFSFVRLSPFFMPPDGVQTGFNGDYTGLVIVGRDEAHPMWSDTRNRAQSPEFNGVSRDEDAFTTSVPLP